MKGIEKGFTLIELIIVFTVLSMLSVVGIASFVDYTRSQTLVNDSNNIITVLGRARSDAQSQVKKDGDCINNATLSGFIITFSKLGGTYALGRICSDNPIPHTIVSYTLSKNVSFDSNTDIVTVFYPVLTGQIVLNSDTTLTSGKIILDLSPTLAKRQITIEKSGIITSQAL